VVQQEITVGEAVAVAALAMTVLLARTTAVAMVATQTSKVQHKATH